MNNETFHDAIEENIKVDKYIFTGLATSRIKMMIEEAYKNNIELGAILCSKLDNLYELYIDNIIKGDEIHIENLKRICEEGKIAVGDFHTHAYRYDPSEFVFSPEDLYYILDNDITGVGFIDGTLVFNIRILKDDDKYLQELLDDNIKMKNLVYNFERTEEEKEEYDKIEDKIYHLYTSTYVTHISNDKKDTLQKLIHENCVLKSQVNQ